MNYFPQYNREFVCTDVKSKYWNPAHDNILGAKCYPAYVEAGKRAWILVNIGNGDPHRLHTSEVIGTCFEEIKSDDQKTVTGYRYTIETENTEYVFETPYKEADE